MKISLWVIYRNDNLEMWTPNHKTKIVTNDDFRRRLLIDVYLKTYRIYSHCGNYKRIVRAFPALENL